MPLYRTFIFCASLFFAFQAMPSKANSSKEAFCLSLLDNLVSDIRFQYSENSLSKSSHEQMCRQFQSTKSDDQSLFAWASSYGGFDYNRSTILNVMDNFCSSNEINLDTRDKKVEYIKTLNPYMGRAALECATEQTSETSTDTFIVLEAMSRQFSGDSYSVTFDFSVKWPTKLNGYEANGFESCRSTIDLNMQVDVSEGPVNFQVTCDRPFQPTGLAIFPKSCFQLNTDKGGVNATDPCLPIVGRPQIGYKWVKVRSNKPGPEFHINSGCKSSDTHSQLCHEGNLYNDVQSTKYYGVVQAWGIGSKDGSGISHWFGKDAIVTPDRKSISISGQFQCSGGNKNSQLPADTYVCTKTVWIPQ